MEAEVYLQLRKIEDTHWWFVARRAIIKHILCSMQLPQDGKILDIGCGTGGNLAMLKAFGEVAGLEMNEAARDIAQAREVCPIHLGSLPDNIPFQGQQFDLVTLLDVLEHIGDHAGTLKVIEKILEPGGRVIITVPAFQFLWSGHDERHHHKRRYNKHELTQVLLESGLQPLHVTYYNMWLFPVIVVLRLVKKLLGQHDSDDEKPPSLWLNNMLRMVFESERHLVMRTELPFGVSLLAVAQRAQAKS